MLHIRSNDINIKTKDILNTEKIKEITVDTINIDKSCINLGVKEVIISSSLLKNNISLTRLIRKVNDSLREKCVLNGFGFISNNNISKTHLWKDGIHLGDLGINILAGTSLFYPNLVDNHDYVKIR